VNVENEVFILQDMKIDVPNSILVHMVLRTK
jgi:hypothetical protein